MAKISFNITEQLDKKIREYAKKNKLTITAACNELMSQSFNVLDASDDLSGQIEALKTQLEGLKSENNDLKIALEKSKDEKIEEYKATIAEYKTSMADYKASIDEYKNVMEKSSKTAQDLIDIMKADRILQAGEKIEKPGFFGRIKALFSGKNNEHNDNI